MKMNKGKEEKLDQEGLHRLLCYNPLSGNFMWRIASNNRIRVGGIAGTFLYRKGRQARIHIKIYGNIYQAHRLAFLYIRGYWPRDEIDHKDGDGCNNRWLNLRGATRSQNAANRSVNGNNKLGIMGVDTNQKSDKLMIPHWV